MYEDFRINFKISKNKLQMYWCEILLNKNIRILYIYGEHKMYAMDIREYRILLHNWYEYEMT